MKGIMKFRIWTGEKLLTTSDELEGYYINSDGIVCEQVWDWLEERPDYKVLYSTGLFDKDGIEIFEGDKLNIHQFLFEGYEVERELTCIIEQGIYGWMATNIQCEYIREYMGYTKEDMVNGDVECELSAFYGLHEESFTNLGSKYETTELNKETNNA